jgi:hypothetical protein
MAQIAVWILVPPYMKFHITKTNTLSLETFMSFITRTPYLKAIIDKHFKYLGCDINNEYGIQETLLIFNFICGSSKRTLKVKIKKKHKMKTLSLYVSKAVT